ncbi:MAG: pyrroline-5-carboxylate reductase [Salaquimonas sp.]|nr:pyrroline-5-carboxylate reductase [Salaquimonas sp.]
MNSDFTLALVGAGNMGGAMLGGWLAEGLAPERITVVDPSPPPAMAELISQTSIRHAGEAIADFAPDVMVLAVKPQIMGAVLPTIAPMMGSQTVAVSVAAGTTIAALEAGLGGGTGGEAPAVVRAMPNTPALVRRGITAACPNRFVTARQREIVDGLLRAVGKVAWVEDEGLIDAVTAVSGSGPAYVFHLAECMAQAGVAAGLPAELAMELARETVSGAGELMVRSSETPAKLRENVTSPNGTTAAALSVLMGEDAMAKLIARAIAAAKMRSEELSG